MWKVITSAPLLPFPGGKGQMIMDIAAVMDIIHYYLLLLSGDTLSRAVVLPGWYLTSVSGAECSWNLHELAHCLTRQSVCLDLNGKKKTRLLKKKKKSVFLFLRYFSCNLKVPFCVLTSWCVRISKPKNISHSLKKKHVGNFCSEEAFWNTFRILRIYHSMSDYAAIILDWLKLIILIFL